MYSHKNLKCGFVILCPEHAIALLKATAKSIRSLYEGFPFICVTDSSANEADMAEMKTICPTYKAKDTITSLINTGMKFAPSDWNFLICAGTTLRQNLHTRYSFFIESEKDILFPIADKKTDFVDGTLNGLFINKKTWNEVGEMASVGPLEVVKLMWALEAVEKGVKFKALANMKLC